MGVGSLHIREMGERESWDGSHGTYQDSCDYVGSVLQARRLIATLSIYSYWDQLLIFIPITNLPNTKPGLIWLWNISQGTVTGSSKPDQPSLHIHAQPEISSPDFSCLWLGGWGNSPSHCASSLKIIMCMMCYGSTGLVCMQKHLSHCTGGYWHSYKENSHFPCVTSKIILMMSLPTAGAGARGW